MNLSVIICTYNRCEGLRGVLECLERQNICGALEWEVVVVDNNSNDRTREVVHCFVEKSPNRFRYVFEKSQGKSFALNTGIKEARGDILAFTDDDCIPSVDWVAMMNNEFRQHPDLIGIGGRVEPYGEGDTKTTTRTSRQRICLSNLTLSVTHPPIIGCNMAFRKGGFEKAGYFDTDLGPGYSGAAVGEDMDFVYRAFKAGLKICYAPEVVTYHNHGRTTEESKASVGREYLRGRGAFYFKHMLKLDLVISRFAYWELRGLLRNLLRKLISAQSPREELFCLSGLAGGFFFKAKASLKHLFVQKSGHANTATFIP